MLKCEKHQSQASRSTEWLFLYVEAGTFSGALVVSGAQGCSSAGFCGSVGLGLPRGSQGCPHAAPLLQAVHHQGGTSSRRAAEAPQGQRPLGSPSQAARSSAHLSALKGQMAQGSHPGTAELRSHERNELHHTPAPLVADCIDETNKGEAGGHL